MTSFAHVDYPAVHPGLARVERAVDVARQTARSFDSARGAATMLLAAIVSALLVVANEVVESWTEGHLLAAWVLLWAVGFAALALFAVPVRRSVGTMRHALSAWRQARREAEADREIWEVALADARVMADLSRAMSARASGDLRPLF